ncbi:hypothetical protein AB0E08_46370 [Streptomyces sp. NPDC048281]|uniref:hypothetical protein n=1 Tax=Streptomyces sp. NPDC048281 TaxID=3154715 RepID=UPI003429DFB1
MEVRLLDATVLDQVPGRRSRCRAARGALLPAPLRLSMAWPPALRLIALILSAHSADHPVCSIGMNVFTRLGVCSREQTAELLDRLVALRALTAWCPYQETDEVLWQSRPPRTEPGPLTWHSQQPHR